MRMNSFSMQACHAINQNKLSTPEATHVQEDPTVSYGIDIVLK